MYPAERAPVGVDVLHAAAAVYRSLISGKHDIPDSESFKLLHLPFDQAVLPQLQFRFIPSHSAAVASSQNNRRHTICFHHLTHLYWSISRKLRSGKIYRTEKSPCRQEGSRGIFSIT